MPLVGWWNCYDVVNNNGLWVQIISASTVIEYSYARLHLTASLLQSFQRTRKPPFKLSEVVLCNFYTLLVWTLLFAFYVFACEYYILHTLCRTKVLEILTERVKVIFASIHLVTLMRLMQTRKHRRQQCKTLRMRVLMIQGGVKKKVKLPLTPQLSIHVCFFTICILTHWCQSSSISLAIWMQTKMSGSLQPDLNIKPQTQSAQ